MFPGCGEEEDFFISIQVWSDEIDQKLFNFVGVFQRGCCPGGKNTITGFPKKIEDESLTIEGYLIDELYFMFKEGMYLTVF